MTAAIQSTAIEKASNAITAALQICKIDTLKALPAMERSITMANGVSALRLALTDEFMDRVVMPLAGTRLGFRTDRDNSDKPAYTTKVVREVCVEALIRGFHLTNNEFNIIADNFYAAQTGLERQVREYPGLSGFEYSLSVPVPAGDKGTLVGARASWWIQGEKIEFVCDVVPATKSDGTPLLKADGTNILIDERIPVRVNSGQGPDAVLGKAKRKLYSRILEKLTGMSMPEADFIDTEGTVVPDKTAAAKATEDMIAKHKAKAEAKNGAKAEAPAAEPSKPAPRSDTNGD